MIEHLSNAHDKAGFKSAVGALDRYLTHQASQDIRRRVSGCFVAVATGTKTVVGYYSLATTSLPLPDIAEATAKRLPRYPLVPAVLMGRLAVAEGHRGKGLGAALLVDAIARTLRAELMAFAIVVDAKDDAAVAFYRHHGFVAFTSKPTALYLPLAEAARELGLAP
jgi:GNAT superfamily N-acetyltransferase